MRIVLVGYMGSGKSLVGELISEEFNFAFKDLDQEIEKRETRSISAIFENSGEIFFRKKEAEVLEDLLEIDEDFVLSLGGGTPCYGRNLDVIKSVNDVRMVYLKTSLEELQKRLNFERDKRPLLAHLNSPDALKDFIRKHLFERTYYYNQSHIIISTDAKTPSEIVAELKQQLD